MDSYLKASAVAGLVCPCGLDHDQLVERHGVRVALHTLATVTEGACVQTVRAGWLSVRAGQTVCDLLSVCCVRKVEFTTSERFHELFISPALPGACGVVELALRGEAEERTSAQVTQTHCKARAGSTGSG